MILKKRPLNQQVYEHIKEDIISGTYVQGQKLVIDELADRLGTSKTPVRDAVNNLIHEGLLENTKSEIRVRKLSDEDIKMLEEALMSLVLTGYELCIRKGLKNPLVQSLILSLKSQYESNFSEHVSEPLNNAMNFDKTFVYTTQNIHLMRTIDEYMDFFAIMLGNYQSLPENRAKSLEEHSKILEAVKEDDAELLKVLVANHFIDSTLVVKNRW